MNSFSSYTKLLLATFSIITLALLSGCGGGGGNTPTGATLSSIAITPDSTTTLAKGTSTTLTATGTYSDGTSADISTQVTWISDHALIASVGSTTGIVHGEAATGTATVTATLGSISSNGVIFNATPATLSSFTITASPTLPKGKDAQLIATGKYSDLTTGDVTAQVTWTSNNTSIATVVGGLVHGVAVGGPVTVTAAYTGLTSQTASITVTDATLSSFTITAPATLPKGKDAQLIATGTYSDLTTGDVTAQVTWTSSNTSIATVVGGLVHGVALGPVTITAAYTGLTSQTASITVDPATLSSFTIPASATLPNGLNSTLSATGIYSDGSSSPLTTGVTWTSSNTSIATVDSTGIVHGVAVGGPVTVTAAYSGLTSQTASITVTAATLTGFTIPASATLPNGLNATLSATAIYSDGSSSPLTTGVTWTSSNTSIATVDSTGIVHGVAVGGPITVTAAYSGLTSQTASITVDPATLSSFTITASATLPKDTDATLSATGIYSDGSSSPLMTGVTWTSSNTSIATVDSTGIVHGVAVGGPITVTAAYSGLTSQTANINVTPVYATWNPADAAADFIFSTDHLTATSPSASYDSCRATIGISSGTAFWEVVVGTGGADRVVGIETLSASYGWVGSDANGWGIWTANGDIYNGSVPVAYGNNGNQVPAGTVIGFGLNMTAGTLQIWLNGSPQGIAVTGLTGMTIYPATTGFGTGVTANFGATPFQFPQDGYNAGVYQP